MDFLTSIYQHMADNSFQKTGDPLEVFLPLIGGICWSVVYVMLIYHTWASRDKLFIPVLALSLNFIWEFLYAFFLFVPVQQKYINKVWFVLDLIILIYSWRNYLNIHRAKGLFENITFLITQLVIGSLVNWMFAAVVPDSCAFYSAFMINLFMSYVFITQAGEVTPTFSVAFFKLVGTAVTSLYGYIFLVWTDFMTVTYLLILVLDCFYLAQAVHFIYTQRQLQLKKSSAVAAVDASASSPTAAEEKALLLMTDL